MERGGFRLLTQDHGGIEPGTWIGVTTVAGTQYNIPVDLIVPEAVLPGGKTRGTRLPVHGKRAAKRTQGLEATLVDQDVMTLEGLIPHDGRRIEVAVAGSAALLVAKTHKLTDRVNEGRAHRMNETRTPPMSSASYGPRPRSRWPTSCAGYTLTRSLDRSPARPCMAWQRCFGLPAPQES